MLHPRSDSRNWPRSSECLEACKANDGTTGVDMIVVTLSGPEIKGAGQLALKTTHVKTISVLNNKRIVQRYAQRL